MRTALAIASFLIALAAPAAAEQRFEWEAAPRVKVELSEGRYALISVTNVERRAICKGLSEWPGESGRVTDDDFLVVGEKDPKWSYIGVMIYPSDAFIRVAPGETIRTRVDLISHYRSSVADDRIVRVEWLTYGFSYCSYVLPRNLFDDRR